MQIQTNENGELEIKTKKAVITFNSVTKVNDVELEGSGEYEIGSVAIEGVDDNIYIFKAEEILFGSINFKNKIPKEDIEKLSNTEILIVRLDGEIEQAVDQVNQIEPNVVVYAGSPEAKEKLSKTSSDFKSTELIKITKADISEQKAYFIETHPVA